MAKLTITESGQASVFELFEDEATIGRGASNAIQVSDGHASKVHAAVRRIGGKAKLVDLESKNGTKVNGEFSNQRWLEDGDTITIGEATLVYSGVEAVPAGRGGGSRAPAVSGSAVATAAAGAPARPMPQVRSGADRDRARVRERRPRDDDDEEGPRVVPKRGGNSAAVAMMVGFGLVGLLALMFFMLSRSGAGSNAAALAEGKRMWGRAKTEPERQAAIAYLEQNSNPKDEDGYKSVKEELDSWKAQMPTFAVAAQGEEALKVYKKIEFDWIELHKGINTKETITARLNQFAQTYMGTPWVQTYLHDPYQPHNKLRALAGEDQASDAMAKIFKAYAALPAATDPGRPAYENDVRSMLVKFRQDFPKSMIVDEIDRSGLDPFPEFRRLLGLK